MKASLSFLFMHLSAAQECPLVSLLADSSSRTMDRKRGRDRDQIAGKVLAEMKKVRREEKRTKKREE